MSPRKHAGKRASRRSLNAPPLWLSAALLLVATGALLVALATRYEWDWWPQLVNREQASGSVSTLEEIRELSRLETLSYVRRSVFPHDFLQEHLTVPQLLRKISIAGTTAAEALEPEELTHLRAANLAAALRFGTTGTGEQFVVVTTALVYGYDLEVLASDLEAAYAAHSSPDPLVFQLPRPQLLSVLTENVNRENYPFPAIYLDAEGWRRVTSFVEDHITVTAPIHDLVQSAEANGKNALRTLLDPEGNRLRME